MPARRPILRWVDQATIASASVAQYACLVDVTTNDQQQVQLPAGARALRYHGVMLKGQGPPSVFPASGDKVEMQKTGRAYMNLTAVNGGSAKTCLPGDWAVIHNALGDVSSYVLGSGTAVLPGMFRTRYTNANATAPVPVEVDQHPILVVQAEPILGFNRAISANNTRFLTRDGSEATAEEVLWEAPHDGTLRGLRISAELGVGPAGSIVAKVKIKVPGAGWTYPQVNAADWGLTFTPGTEASDEDAIETGAIASTIAVAIVKGTKVAIEVAKNNAVANVTQLSGRLIFF